MSWRDNIKVHPAADLFPMISEAELRELGEDIKANGLRNRIVFWGERLGSEAFLLDGRNRLDAMELAGLETANLNRTTVYGSEGVDPYVYAISLNLKRRHLDESQRAMVAAKLATLQRGDNQHSPIGETSQGKAAELLNVGKRSVERAADVREHGAPELIQAVERGEVSVSAAADVASLPAGEQREIVARGEREILEAAKQIRGARAETRRAERIQKLTEISGSNSDLPTERKYPIIYADPPWRYEHPPIGGNRVIENHYPTMSLGEICALPVKDLATEDAVLFMWATAPKLAECIDVLKAWGFDYRTCMVWVKDKIGMGFYVRNQHELILIAKRGDPPMPKEEDRLSSVIEAIRGEHSVKPTEFYERIERMYPELPKIGLFARNARDGWATWGNQAPVDPFDIPQMLERRVRP